MSKPIVWPNLTATDHTRIWEHINNAVAAIQQANAFTGTESAIVGASPPPGTPIRRDEYKVIAAVEGDGGGLPIPFQTPFPNGLTSCLVGIVAGAEQLIPYSPGITTSQYYAIARYANGTPIPSGTQVTISVSATGW
jgi:hypothetical protein